MGSWEDHMHDVMEEYGRAEAALQELLEREDRAQTMGQITKDNLLSWLERHEEAGKSIRRILENTTFIENDP